MSHVEMWLNDMQKNSPDGGVGIVLVGNKRDLEDGAREAISAEAAQVEHSNHNAASCERRVLRRHLRTSWDTRWCSRARRPRSTSTRCSRLSFKPLKKHGRLLQLPVPDPC